MATVYNAGVDDIVLRSKVATLAKAIQSASIDIHHVIHSTLSAVCNPVSCTTVFFYTNSKHISSSEHSHFD